MPYYYLGKAVIFLTVYEKFLYKIIVISAMSRACKLSIGVYFLYDAVGLLPGIIEFISVFLLCSIPA